MEKYYKCEAELKTLTEKKHSLIQKVMDQRDDDVNSKAVLAMNPTNTLNKLRRDLRECEERIRTVELDIIKLN
jgi:transcription elongation GreA/GreB family factor